MFLPFLKSQFLENGSMYLNGVGNIRKRIKISIISKEINFRAIRVL